LKSTSKNAENWLNLSYFAEILAFLGENSDFWPIEVTKSHISAKKRQNIRKIMIQ